MHDWQARRAQERVRRARSSAAAARGHEVQLDSLEGHMTITALARRELRGRSSGPCQTGIARRRRRTMGAAVACRTSTAATPRAGAATGERRAEAGRGTAVASAGHVVRAHDVGGPAVRCVLILTDSLTRRLDRVDTGESGRSGETGLPKGVDGRSCMGGSRPPLRWVDGDRLAGKTAHGVESASVRRWGDNALAILVRAMRAG